MNRVTVSAPATTANLGPGFDTLGIALNLYNTVSMSIEGEGLDIICEGNCSESIPKDESNIIYQSARKVFERTVGVPGGLKISINTEIPPARGLGSSAAAIVCGAVAANMLAGERLGQREVLQICTDLEGHPDNIVPALVGGFAITTLTSTGHVEYIRSNPPGGIYAVAAVPGFELKTKDAREVLPKTFGFDDVVYNVGHAAFYVGAFLTGNLGSLRFAMEDKLHQPYRESLIPGMKSVFDAAMGAGAKSVSISGSGPTLIAFAESGMDAISQEMERAWRDAGVDCYAIVLELDLKGARVMSEE